MPTKKRAHHDRGPALLKNLSPYHVTDQKSVSPRLHPIPEKVTILFPIHRPLLKKFSEEIQSEKENLDQISYIVWKLLDNSIVEALDVLDHTLVIAGSEVDSNTLSSETTGTTDTMQVVLW